MNGVTRMLADYYSAFSTLNIEAIKPYFHQPALIIAPPGVVAVPTSEALAAFFAPTIETLRAKGYARSEFTSVQVKQLSATAASASGVAVRYKSDGQELSRVGITYLLHKTEADWKIAVMVLGDTGRALPPE
ncbi:MAG: nuclear transport factor 2 family protein [Acidobacteriota bacterium]|nr:nuclear transport factor 2 family protein [Acidobacteriota bacterium]